MTLPRIIHRRVRYCAETLFESAEFLKGGLDAGRARRRLEKHGYMDTHYSTYGLLVGYAQECGFKGLWVSNGGALIKNRKVGGIEGVNDHDLLELSRKAGVHLSKTEQCVVNRLSYFIRAAGRYPIPRTAEEWAPKRIAGRGEVDPGFFNLAEWELARKVTLRVLAKLKEEMYSD